MRFAAQSNCQTPAPSEGGLEGKGDQLTTTKVVEEEELLNERMEADGGSAEEATGAEQSDAAPAWEWDDYNVSCLSPLVVRLFTQPLLSATFVGDQLFWTG